MAATGKIQFRNWYITHVEKPDLSFLTLYSFLPSFYPSFQLPLAHYSYTWCHTCTFCMFCTVSIHTWAYNVPYS